MRNAFAIQCGAHVCAGDAGDEAEYEGGATEAVDDATGVDAFPTRIDGVEFAPIYAAKRELLYNDCLVDGGA